MKIVKVNPTPILDKIKKEHNFLSTIFNNIFLICKSDPSFSTKKIEVDKLDEILSETNEKLKKHSDMLNKSTEIKYEFIRKIDIIEKENTKLKSTLLDKLGSEL